MKGNSPRTIPSRPSVRPSQPPPLGAPGFTFPKLPNLKSPTSIVDATAFLNIENKTTELPKNLYNPDRGNFDIPGTVDIQRRPISNLYPLTPKITSTVATTTISPIPKFTPPPRFSIPPHYTFASTLPNPTSLVSFKEPTPQTIGKENMTTKHPFHQLTRSTQPSPPRQTPLTRQPTPTWQPSPTRQQATSRPPPPSRHANYSLQSTSVRQTIPSVTTTISFTSSRPITKQPVTFIKQIPTRQPVPSRQTEVPEQFPPLKQTTPQQFKFSFATHSPQKEGSFSHAREPEVITAPSLPRLPGQFSPALKQSPPFRLPFKSASTTSHTLPPRSSIPPKTQNLGDAFAQNFGFDPESIVYESDFRPVKEKPPGAVLAFEVSSSDLSPIRVPLGPRPPRWSSQRRPAGPRTSEPIGFAQRKIKVDDETINKFPGSPHVGTLTSDTLGPIFHPSVTFRERLEHSPIPLPVAMGPVVPLLGGGASNTPLIPNKSLQPPPRKIKNTYMQNGPVRSSVSVDRIGKPQGLIRQQPARRRVTALIQLPDDLPVLVPQLVGPKILKPILNFPLENEELAAAASTQVFASDGRRLAPDTVPAPPPQLVTRRSRPSDFITNRPQVGPYRGELPPPVPAQVPHLTQFFRQRRPLNRRTTLAPPPLGDEFISPGRLAASGNNPQPAIVSHQEIPVVAAALLPHQELTADIGNNEVMIVSQHPTTAEAYAPARSPTTERSKPAVVSADNNRTNLNILKDVWAILTMEDPSLKPKHPRDDAHPDHDHDHLDRQERRKRETDAANSSSTKSRYSFISLIVLVHLLGR